MRILRTTRLVLRPWAEDEPDLDFLFDMYSRWQVQRFIGVVPRVMESREEALDRVLRWRAIDDGVRGVWAVTEEGQRLGTLLLKDIPWSADSAQARRRVPQDVEIGWHFHPEAWGHGYATEAAAAVLAHGVESGLDRVVAVTNPANLASRAVCERIGMTHRGPTTLYYDTTCELFDLVEPA